LEMLLSRGNDNDDDNKDNNDGNNDDDDNNNNNNNDGANDDVWFHMNVPPLINKQSNASFRQTDAMRTQAF
jgi:hypothetical protein